MKKTTTTTNEKNVNKTADVVTTSKKELAAEARTSMIARVDAWLAKYAEEQTAAGHNVIIKTWVNFPNCRALRVDNVTFFQINISRNGARLNAKSNLVPKDVWPEGANVINDVLDLSIPTFDDIEAGLAKYAEASLATLEQKAVEKAAKAEAEAKAKAEAKRIKAEAKAAEKAAIEKAKAEAKVLIEKAKAEAAKALAEAKENAVA